jgi:hypothetical protein
VTAAEFEAISPGLPAHEAEVMAGYRPEPSIAEQNATHGARAPAPDYGVDDAGKYYPGGM